MLAVPSCASPHLLSPSLPLFHVSVSTSSASVLFPSPDLAQLSCCALASFHLSHWLSFLFFFFSRLLLSSWFQTQQHLYSTSIQLSVFSCSVSPSCISFVSSELSGFSHSLFSLPVASFLTSLALSHFFLSSHSHYLSHALILLFPSISSSHCLLYLVISFPLFSYTVFLSTLILPLASSSVLHIRFILPSF